MKLVLTAAAEADLRDIFRYSRTTFGKTVAARYLGALNAKIARLVANPQIGRRFDTIDDDMRRIACLRHHIYFRTIGDELRIVRILHQHMHAAERLGRST